MTAAILFFALAVQDAPPSVEQIQTWFEAGQYQQIIDKADTAEPVDDPKAQYFLASSYEKLDRLDEAGGVYQRLISREATDPWAPIGRAASALLASGAPTPEAVEAAQLAAEQAIAALTPDAAIAAEGASMTGPPAAFAHYQMGIVKVRLEDYAGAAEAFELATTHDPALAYAYYYGGMANSRIDRSDQMAINFERFLALAPEAPEAVRVQSLMRSVRGR